MEDLNDKILNELKEKAIERSDDVEVSDNVINEELIEPQPEPEVQVESPEVQKPVKKTKKVRSEAQKAAFEKARKARAENLKIRKQLDAEKKEQRKKEKEIVKAEVQERLNNPDFPQVKSVKPTTNPIPHENDRFGYREQVVNNYYYYGRPPTPNEENLEPPVKTARKEKKVRRPPTPDVSEESESEVSDVDEPQSYRELQHYDEDLAREGLAPPEPDYPKLKFRFA